MSLFKTTVVISWFVLFISYHNCYAFEYKILDALTRPKLNEDIGIEKPDVHISIARGEAEGFHLLVRGEIEQCVIDAGYYFDTTLIKTTVYREHFVETKRLSYRSTFSPGWFPDALIPIVNPYDGTDLVGARFDASPYDIPFKSSAAFWIEFYVSPDTPSGEYECYFEISSAKNPSPVSMGHVYLKVWAFELPKRTHVRGEFGYGGTKFNQLFGIENAGLLERHKVYQLFLENLLKHKLQPFRPYAVTTFNLNRETGAVDYLPVIDFVRDYLDTLQANSFLIPFSPGWPFSKPLTDDRNKVIKYLSDTYEFFAANGWEKYIYTYTIDEPNVRDGLRIISKTPAYIRIRDSIMYIIDNNSKQVLNSFKFSDKRYNTIEKLIAAISSTAIIDTVINLNSYLIDGVHTAGTFFNQQIDISSTNGGIIEITEYEIVRQFAELVHEGNPNIKFMLTEQARPEHAEWGDLYGSTNIWCPLFTLYNDEFESARLAAGDELWCYTALCQGGNPRPPFWEIDFPLLEYRVPLWIAYRFGITGILYWESTYWQQSDDVWINPETYGIDNTLPYNGEGSLYYPGVDAGFTGPVESLRLKALRDGVEDYEYLFLADSLGIDVSEYLNLVGSSWTSWTTNPEDIYACREALGEKIHATVSQGINKTANYKILLPNPIRNDTTIELKTYNITSIQIFSLNGSLVNTITRQQFNESMVFHVPASGIYYIKYFDKANTWLQKVVVMK